ncbi:hypothetical protein BGZ96_012305 [Linnemannia gamsii]|uniref:Uncharacterized protein n=1 Tax=Linnemannia gamsii TaxID=64522 RepID=A0ABQ7KCD6_9FUNG|nr:hypothetical protein BGZ96_012305 [Linnemannia gamsii]
MLRQNIVPRLVSLANAARFLRTARLARTTTTPPIQESVFARHNLTNAFSRPPQSRYLSSSLSSRPIATLGLQGHAARGFAKQSSLFVRGGGTGLRSTVLQQQTRAFSKGHSKRRRPFRFLWKVMVISTAVVALPAILLFGAPVASLILVPVAVGGIVGGALLLTGSLLFLVLPIVAISGATAFWFISLPASMTVRDLSQIIKRSKKDSCSTALGALGSDWEVQTARSDEWFKWTFPRTAGDLDRINIRMGVFDPNDHSERKENTFKWLDRLHDYDDDSDHEGSNNNKNNNHIKKSYSSSKSHFEIHNNSTFAVENLSVIRQNDHFLIEIEDDGAKLLDQKWGRKFVELARIVDRAASEMEATTPGLKLGNQVVLVQRRGNNSFWDKISIHGDLALRIPIDRQWVQDVTEES